MNSTRRHHVTWRHCRATGLALMATLLVACGGSSDLPHTAQLSATLTPSRATVTVAGTVTLNGSVSGFTSDPFIQWWMQEKHDGPADGSFNCDNISDPASPLIASCQFGYISVTSMSTTSTTAIYHAPLTPGVYHVTLRATQMGIQGFDFAEIRGTAEITVTR
jgi:hypothetical protein